MILAASVAASLFLTSSVNHRVGAVLARFLPDTAWMATAAIPSCVALMALFLLLADPHPLGWPSVERDVRASIVRLSSAWLGIWLGCSILVAWLIGHWITYAHGWPAILAFLVFGPVGEELLFRGLIFEHARRLWAGSAWPAVLVSAAAFSLHHVQLHPYPLQEFALAQIMFTFPMGVVFAQLRERSGSVWPALMTHVATNLPAAF